MKESREPFKQRLQHILHPVPSTVGDPDHPEIRDPNAEDLIPKQLRPAAVLMPLVRRDDVWQVLLTRRTRHLKHHAGQIAFPGGRMEAQDRHPQDTALRETQEEVGIDSGHIEVVGSLDRLVTVTGYTVVPLVGLVDSSAEMTLDPNEVEEAFTVPLSFLLNSDNLQKQSAMYRGRRRQFYVYRFKDHDIWGATAAMLVNFAERYHGV